MADQTPEEGVRQALERWHAAVNRLVSTGNADEVLGMLSRGEDATAFLGWGGYEWGQAAVRERWVWAGEQFKGGGPVRHETLSLVVAADPSSSSGQALAYAAELEHIPTRLDGMERPIEYTNRVTHIFRREDGEWRLVHRHGQRLEERFKPGERLR
jgi:ketosteroid isomerase-like protein